MNIVYINTIVVHIYTMFNWDDLRIFIAVARTASVRGAARDLHTTHATVSRRLKTLEDQLSNSLVERRREGVHLTALGQRILALAENAEHSMEEIGRTAFGMEEELTGPVKLSIYEDLYTVMLSSDFADFQRKHPGLQLEIQASPHMSNLANRETDVAIRITRSPPQSAVGKKLVDSPLAIYATRHYLENRPEPDRWVTTAYEGASRPLTPGPIVGRSDSARVAQQMIRNGSGIGLLPCFMGDTDTDLYRLPDSAPIPDNEIWALVHSDIRKNPRVRLLLDFVYQIFSKSRPIFEGKKPNIYKAQ